MTEYPFRDMTSKSIPEQAKEQFRINFRHTLY
jgi:hypothetical protein